MPSCSGGRGGSPPPEALHSGVSGALPVSVTVERSWGEILRGTAAISSQNSQTIPSVL